MSSINNALQRRNFLTADNLRPHLEYFQQHPFYKDFDHGYPEKGGWSINVFNRFLNM